MSEEQREENHVLRARREKLDALEKLGVAPFAYSFDRSHSCGDALALLGAAETGPTVRGGSPPRTEPLLDQTSLPSASTRAVTSPRESETAESVSSSIPNVAENVR